MDTAGPFPIGDWAYNWRGAPRPFVHPVTTPSGRVLSVDAPADHPWHHALWFAIKFVNGENFWEEYGDFGLLVQSDPPEPVAGRDGSAAGRWRSTVRWHRPTVPGETPGDVSVPGETPGDVVVDQVVEMSLRHVGRTTAMDWDVRLVPRADVVFDRTPFTTWGGYGGLTFRGRGDWHDTELRTARQPPCARLLGDTATWCALEGLLGGPDGSERRAGIALFDHPENPNHPTPWYASTRADTYGDEGWSNFVNAAFLWNGPLEVAAGDQLRCRHRVLTWDDTVEPAALDAAWADWAQRPEPA